MKTDAELNWRGDLMLEAQKHGALTSKRLMEILGDLTGSEVERLAQLEVERGDHHLHRAKAYRREARKRGKRN